MGSRMNNNGSELNGKRHLDLRVDAFDAQCRRCLQEKKKEDLFGHNCVSRVTLHYMGGHLTVGSMQHAVRYNSTSINSSCI